MKRLINFLLLPVLFACSTTDEILPETLLTVDAQGNSRMNNIMLSGMVNDLPKEELSDAEVNTLLFMREEEKLARDVYLHLYDQWKKPIFSNIAASEESHMNAIKILIDKYELTDPVVSCVEGEFSNPQLGELFQTLTTRGEQSIEKALEVGATIEDLDIADLKKGITETDNQDITLVYENLMKGSRNHLRSFYQQLNDYGVTYRARYISPEELDQIVNSPIEKGH